MQLLTAHGQAHPGKKWNPGDKAAFKEGEMLRTCGGFPDAYAVVELLAGYLGSVVGNQLRDEDAETLQGVLSWHMEEGSPCARDDEWRIFALVCSADLTFQRALVPACSSERKAQFLSDAIRQCDECERQLSASPDAGRQRGLLAQSVFVRAKALLMQGDLAEALEATQRASRLHKREKPRLGPFVALKLQLPLLKAKIQKEQDQAAAVSA